MTYAEAVALFASWHREDDDQPDAIYLFRDPNGQVIRFIEVSTKVPETGELFPVAFAPTDEMPLKTVVAQVTPHEWAQILAGDIHLPTGWSLPAEEV